MCKSYVLLLGVSVMLCGCASVPTQDIRTEAQADLKTDFNAYKTYAWLGTAAVVNDPYGLWKTPSFDAVAEIKHQIDRQLRKRGMTESYSNPDLMVVFAAGVDMETFKLKMAPETKMHILENAPTGGLIVALVDGKSGYVNWVGVAAAEIQKKPDERIAKKRLEYAVTEMFKKLPRQQ
jgi:hypothetical protein